MNYSRCTLRLCEHTGSVPRDQDELLRPARLTYVSVTHDGAIYG
jgi:hypothetical protein